MGAWHRCGSRRDWRRAQCCRARRAESRRAATALASWARRASSPSTWAGRPRTSRSSRAASPSSPAKRPSASQRSRSRRSTSTPSAPAADRSRGSTRGGFSTSGPRAPAPSPAPRATERAEGARLLEIQRVVVPSVAAVLSAWGMLATDLRYELVRSHVSEVGRMTAAALRTLFARLEREGRRRLARFDGPVSVRRALDMRYGEQIFEIQVDLDGVDLQAADLMDQVAERFHRRHEALYAYSAPGQEVVVVNVRVAVVGALPVLPAGAGALGRGTAGPTARRRVWLGGRGEGPPHPVDALPARPGVQGPAGFRSATTPGLVREGEPGSGTPP